MSIRNTCLREFIELVPVCAEAADLAMVSAVLRDADPTFSASSIYSSEAFYKHLLLLNARQQPAGLVSLHRLLPYLIGAGLFGNSSGSTDRGVVSADLLLRSISPSIIEPVMVLSGDLPIDQFIPLLDVPQPSHYVLIDDKNVLGLLDHARLLWSLAMNLLDSGESQANGQSALLSEPIEPRRQKAIKWKQQQDTRLVQQLLAQKAELEMQLKSQQKTINRLIASQEALQAIGINFTSRGDSGTPPTLNTENTDNITTHQFHPLLLNPLLGLLERLPLPLMLQTSSGRVIGQNAIWREQVGELSDPGWIRQEAAVFLEKPEGEEVFSIPFEQAETIPLVQSSGQANPARRSAQSLAKPSFSVGNGEQSSSPHGRATPLAQSTSTSELTAGAASALPLGSRSPGTFSGGAAQVTWPEAVETNPLNPGLCHLGPQPGSCICVCPLKNGQEQILQFLKIPLGMLSVQMENPSGSLTAHLGNHPWQSGSDQEADPSFRLATLMSLAEEEPFDPVKGEPFPGKSVTGTPGSPPAAPSPASETLWLVLAQDITEQQQLARELTAKNADLIQLNRLKDEFLACISHELRTPLTAVLGLSSLLKEQTIGDLNQRQMHYAQLIYQSGRHLMAVVNDILDLARMETEQLELVSDPVDIPMVCQRALSQAKQLRLLDGQQEDADGESTLPHFELEIEPGLDLLVADEQRLRQMLVHLLSNAFKFTEVDKCIGLKVNRWGGWIAFTVWDQGIGIPADKQHLIFHKFQQLENPLTRRFEGTGLGLVLTQRFARLHGGDVTFFSKEGEGSQFTILMPPIPPENPPLVTSRSDSSPADDYLGVQVSLNSSKSMDERAIQATSPPPSRDRRLVLIVEVVPQYIETLSDQLTGMGYRVVIARSGTEALEKARRLQPCVIFLNPVLPLLSGWDVLTLLKSNRETQQIPVVVTATKVDESHSHRSYANGWLSLPVQAKALQQALQNHVLEEPQQPEPQSRSGADLTVLRLNPGTGAGRDRPISATDLNHLLQSHHYRVLESDDLDQAELLARVWKPNVVLLDGTLDSPTTYFQNLSQHAFLASLPLVTLDQEATQTANQVPGLLVFPCLAAPEATQPGNDLKTSALLQVIQIAAGYAWRPSILVLDIATLAEVSDGVDVQAGSNRAFGSFPKEAEWLQALTQYLQTAGLRGTMGRSWQEVLQQVQSHSVDLLLVCWTGDTANPIALQMLSTLNQLKHKPPILVLDHRYPAEAQPSSSETLPALLQQLATQILPASLSMAELLEQLMKSL